MHDRGAPELPRLSASGQLTSAHKVWPAGAASWPNLSASMVMMVRPRPYSPLALTQGTAVMLPEEGPHAGRGVVERMGEIGQQITRAEEVVSARPALAAEAARLGIRPGSLVLTIARTYHTDDRAVETADIVIPVERYSLVYEVPVR